MPSTHLVTNQAVAQSNTTLGGRAATKTASRYHLAFQALPTAVVNWWTAVDPTGAWDNETAEILIPNESGIFISLAAFANGDVMICAHGVGSGAIFYAQLREADGTFGALINVSSEVGFSGIEQGNISVVVTEAVAGVQSIFWLTKPRTDFPVVNFVRKLQLFKSTQADLTAWVAQSRPMTNIASQTWTGSCFGMGADGANGIHLFARDGNAGANNILTQLYNISDDSYPDNGTSIGTTASAGSTASYMGVSVLIDGNGVVGITYTVNNDLGSNGDFIYAENYSGWTSHALPDFNVGSAMVDANNHTILGERNEGNVAATTQQIKRFFEGALQETSEKFPGYWLYSQPHHAGVEELYQGEPYWAWGHNHTGAPELVFMQDTDRVYPSSADTTKPTITGHDPNDTATGVAIGTDIYFELDDDKTGVDETTINVTVEGVDAIIDGVFQSGFDGVSSEISADGLGFNVTIDPTSDFSYNQVVNVVVDCDDLADIPNSMIQDVYSFTCVLDTTDPTITGRDPAASEIEVDKDTNIYFELDDTQSGVDSATLTVTIEGGNAILSGVFQSGYTGTISADGLGFNVTINPDVNFSYSQVVNVVVDVDDNVGNSMPQSVYSFTIWPPDAKAPSGGKIDSPVHMAYTNDNPLADTSGWIETQSPPIEYYYDLSLVPDFATILMTTDWQSGTSWQLPILEDIGKRHYLRLRTRDSWSPTPNISPWTVTTIFVPLQVTNHATAARNRLLSQYKGRLDI